MLAKIGPGKNVNLPAGFGIVLKNVGAGDVGRHQVGRELHALKREMQYLRYGADEQRLGQAGDADKETMAAAEHGHKKLFDDVGLADDDLADLLGHTLVGVAEFTGYISVCGG